MRILFLTLGRFQHLEERGIYTDLMRAFYQEGHELYIVSPLERKWQQPTTYTNEQGIHILKVKTGNIRQVNLLEKGISTLRIERQFIKAIQQYFPHIPFDLVIYSTPPITFEKVIQFIKQRDQAKAYLLLKDIFPQNAVDLQLFSKKSVLYKYFRHKERRLYRNADFIGAMSQANVEYILKENPSIAAHRVEVCPNSIEPKPLPSIDVKKIREKYNIPLHQTVFLYGGNLGKPQGIDFLVRCLQASEQQEQAFFVIAGSGTERELLQQYVEKEKPQHVLLLDELPVEEYDELVACCDVGLIFLDYRSTIPNFPSRLLSYMQAGKPVLAVTDRQTDIGQVIVEGQFGMWCESRDAVQFQERLPDFYDEAARQQMGENARRYLEDHYTVRHTYERIMSHF